VISARNRFSNE